jgi:hypothetical protein
MDARSLHTRMHARSQLAVAGADGQRAARALRRMLLQGFHHLQESGGDAVVGPWAGLPTDLMGMVLLLLQPSWRVSPHASGGGGFEGS